MRTVPSGLLIASALALTGCHVDRAPMDAAHAQRVSQINARYDAKLAESDKEWEALERQVDEQRKALIEIVADSQFVPTKRTETEFMESWNACDELEEQEKTNCRSAVGKAYVAALEKRYFKANFQWAFSAANQNPSADLESLLAFYHNSAVLLAIKERKLEIEEHKAKYRRKMQELRADEVQLSAEQRDQEIESAIEDRRRALAVVAAGLQGMSEGMRQASTSKSAYGASGSYGGSSYSGDPEGCSSDFSCGVGRKCVKSNFASSGICMDAVNEFGNRTYSAPDPGSIGPKLPRSTDCKVMTDCPVGFRCDMSSGTCVR